MRKCRKYCNEIDFFSLRCNCAIEKLLTCAKHAHNTHTHLHTRTHTHGALPGMPAGMTMLLMMMMTMATIAL